MPYQELLVLLPCHSLEDFPTYLDSHDADGLLAACTALWHPALVYSARKLPTWCRADTPPLDLTDRLLILPQVAEGWTACDFLERAPAEGALVLHGIANRGELVNAALAGLTDAPPFDDEIVADFFALGYCRLHVELLTRIMRYTSTIDDSRLQSDVLLALDAAVNGDRSQYTEILQRVFDQLCESRRYFFPVDPHLIDLTLVADTTLGTALQDDLSLPIPRNVLLTGQVLEKMAHDAPATVAALQNASERGQLGIAGGEYQEREFSLLPEEIWRADLLRGIGVYERVLNRRPLVYGRRRAGLSPLLPQLLCRTGFHSALHFTLDDGQFPTSPNSKVRWESPDGSVVEALAQVPLDASQAMPFLELPRRLGEVMDRDQAPTLVFAHWPGRACIWFDDLRRIARYAPALGKFVTLEDYFANTVSATDSADFKADDYRMPYLQQDCPSGTPISTLAGEVANAIGLAGVSASETMSALIAGDPQQTSLQHCAEQLAQGRGCGQPAMFIPNGCSFPRQWTAELSAPVEATPPVKQVALVDQKPWASIDLPAMGFVWVGVRETPLAEKPLTSKLEPHVLENEFVTLNIHRETGGIHTIFDDKGRGNRVSQQLAIRMLGPRGAVGSAWRDPDETAIYSQMIAEDIALNFRNHIGGEITSRGRLESPEGEKLASFQQRVGLYAGSRLITVWVDVEIAAEFLALPWENYLCNRLAFPDKDLSISRNVGMTLVECSRRRIEAPLALVVEQGRRRTSLLPGGLAYHRRVAHRTIDTLLVVRGETRRSFRYALGIDVPAPLAAAVEAMTPTWDTVIANGPPHGASGWLFHVDARNVLATAWEATSQGFRVRLQETLGAAGRVCLRCFRPVRSARLTDFLGGTLCELAVEHDKIWLELNACQWVQLEAVFA